MTMYLLEERTIEWLDSLGYDAYDQVPANRPSRFVTVSREGSSVENMVDYPLLTIQTWAETEMQALLDALAIRLEATTHSTPYGVHSMRVNSGPYKFYDEDSDMPRYQTLYDVTCQLVD